MANLCLPIYMATPKILSEEEIQQLLEDRQNGLGLQKTAKKYGIGIPKIHRLEKENNMEIVPAKPPPIQQLSIEDIQRHFQEVQESFAIVLDELQETKKLLLDSIATAATAAVEEDAMEEYSTEEEDIEEELEDLGEKMDWQIAGSTVFAFLGAIIGGLALWRQETQPKIVQYYSPPTTAEEKNTTPPKKSTIPKME